MISASAVAILAVLGLGACAGDDAAGGPEDEPIESLDDLKLDSFREPTDMGEINERGDWSQAELTDDSRYHLWTFSILQHQGDMQIWTRPVDGEMTNTVIYLFKRGENGTWGKYLEKNDDGMWQFSDGAATYTDDLTPFSYLNLALDAGEYGVLVKGKYKTTRGPYFVTYDCNGGHACR